jgi:cell division protein FtsB
MTDRFQNDWTKKIEQLEARVKELEGENKLLKEGIHLTYNHLRKIRDNWFHYKQKLGEVKNNGS